MRGKPTWYRKRKSKSDERQAALGIVTAAQMLWAFNDYHLERRPDVRFEKVSPDGPGQFKVVWDKVRAMWSAPFDWSDDLLNLSVPLLVVIGDDDLITVPHAHALARRVPDGRLAVIPGASHMVPLEHAGLFNRLVLDFTADPRVDTQMPVWRHATTRV